MRAARLRLDSAKDYAAGGGRDARTGTSANLCALRCPVASRTGTAGMTKNKHDSGIRMATSRPDVTGVSAANRIAARHRMTIHLWVEVNKSTQSYAIKNGSREPAP